MTDKLKKINAYVFYSPDEKIWLALATDYWLVGTGKLQTEAVYNLLQVFRQEAKLRTDSLDNCRRKKALCKPNLVVEK